MQGAGDDMATRERAAESAAGGHECVSNQKKNPGIGGNPDGNRGTSGDALLQQRQGQGQGPSEGSFKENVDQGNAFLASEPKEEDTVVKVSHYFPFRIVLHILISSSLFLPFFLFCL